MLFRCCSDPHHYSLRRRRSFGSISLSQDRVSLGDAVHVLVLSIDTTLADLLKLNLERRGIGVRHQMWAACCGVGEATPRASDVVVADLDCPPPACWSGTRRVRALFPFQPVLLLAHDWPDSQILAACRPCRYLQKPFAIQDFIEAVGALAPAA
jgi:DNA-binding response OmpR family regulator